MADSALDPALIPTPEEISRVTDYLREQASTAQSALVEQKRQQAEAQSSGAANLIVNGKVVGADFLRRSWTDEDVPWTKRGDIYAIRLDFDDGTQVLVGINPDGDALTMDITFGSNPNPQPDGPPDSAPEAPTITSVTPGDGTLTVEFDAPGTNPADPIIEYRVTSTPGGVFATGDTSPIVVSGLPNDEDYTVTIAARNNQGWGQESAASDPATPTAETP